MFLELKKIVIFIINIGIKQKKLDIFLYIFSLFILFTTSSLVLGLVYSSDFKKNELGSFSIGGTVSSYPDVFQVTGAEQSYFILPIKNETTVYEGIFTFASSKPVQVQSMNILSVNNSLKIPLQFGTLYTFPINEMFVIPINLFEEPKNMGTVFFSGNGLRLITNEPFLTSYTFSGKEIPSLVTNNLTSGLDIFKNLTIKKS